MTTKRSPRRVSGNPARKAWEPLDIGDVQIGLSPMARAFVESGGAKHHYVYRSPQPAVRCRVFGNNLYDGLVLTFEDGSMHLSFKRRDRSAIRDWRHFQAIKNEVAGAEREAVEIFPPESELTDTANEYHLWVLPPGQQSPVGLAQGRSLLPGYEEMDHASYRQGGSPGARQRAWEPGLPTGLGQEADDAA